MMDKILLLPVSIFFFAALLIFLTPQRWRRTAKTLALSATLLNLLAAILLFKHNLSFSLPWAGWGLEFSLRLYHFNGFIILAVAGFGFLIALYSTAFMRAKPALSPAISNQMALNDNRSGGVNLLFAYFLLTLAFTNAALLADNLVLMLFFWEGLLLCLFGFMAIGKKGAFKTATKAFIIVGITDLCMMLGIALTGHLAGTLTISKINLALGGLASPAFILLMLGAISKAGSMPFHSWIPDAALDAPLPFMALVPAAIDKLLGIYLLARICLDMFRLTPDSWMSSLLMAIGAITIILAVMMALIQKDYKRLLSYHAISQVGYMILGIGTAIPVGIVGGLFHMLNNAIYKSGLFLNAGAVEKQASTTNLEQLGGLARKMPLTFACFIISAASISGVPPFNGFFSKELIYDAALQRGLLFYIAAAGGSFFTAASFLKLGHAAFLGKLRQEHSNVKEAPLLMLLPMIIIACVCILFGCWNALALNALIQPILGERLAGHTFAGAPANSRLVIITLAVLIAAFLNHLFGVKAKGSGLKAVDHIHYAPLLSSIYDKAEKGYFDPYEIGLRIAQVFSRVSWRLDRAIDYLYNNFIISLMDNCISQVKKAHSGNYVRYLSWSLLGILWVTMFLIYSG